MPARLSECYARFGKHVVAPQAAALEDAVQANDICGTDPLVCNELGVLYFQKKDFDMAGSWLRRAKDLLPEDTVSSMWHPTLLNLAHTLRKQCKFAEAVATYQDALALSPHEPGVNLHQNGVAVGHQVSLAVIFIFVDIYKSSIPAALWCMCLDGCLRADVGCAWALVVALRLRFHSALDRYRYSHLTHVCPLYWMQASASLQWCCKYAVPSLSVRVGTFSALGFTYHLMGDINKAIETYHTALGYRADCSMTQELLKELLDIAMEAHGEHCCRHDDPGLM
jgi:tetratricopeptide (TPR) repeat protein